MKFSTLSVGILALLTPLTAAWSKEDREIFRIRDEISAHEVDPEATFYDILGITKGASQDAITQAYRKKSREFHPDKVRQQLRARKPKDGAKSVKGPTSKEINVAVKKASDAQARLSLIAGILKGPSRDRYDHFLSNGFPLWKGTDYYYNRYRPGLGTVIIGLLMFAGGAVHYLILYMNWKRQKEFVGRYVKFARNTAWGGNIPGLNTEPAAAPAPVAEEEEDPAMPMPRNRKERRMMEKEKSKEEGRPKKKERKARASKPSSRDASVAPTGIKKRVVAENGKVLVVDSQGDVFLEEQDEEGNVHEYLLDPEELAAPTYKDTAVVQVPLFLFNASVGRLFSRKADADADAEELAEDESDAAQNTPGTDSAAEDFEVISKSTESLSKGKSSGAQQGGKPSKRKNKKR
ncbi:hypothetical protein PWT90_09011 [Aphanocladium album]|nr:hypothetical protein PWT90_09011 [Aphanocladium album]